MWDLPRPGLEPVSPALAGRFATTAPPGQPPYIFLLFFLTYFFNKFILFYLFLPVFGLRCCTQAFSSCGEQGPLLVAVRGPLIAVASPVAEHGL